MNDRRRRLGRAGPTELALGREGYARDTCSPIARRLADEKQRSLGAFLKVAHEPFAQQRRPCALGVLVESRTDAGSGQLVHECRRRYDGPSVTGSSGNRAERADKSAADPRNLIWGMPAEEGVSEEVVGVVAGGSLPVPQAARFVPPGAPVIAADSGLDNALELGLQATFAIGDFDSASPGAVAAAESSGVRIERHPAEKDATDLELALDVAIAMAPRRILVIATRGGRLDHDLANQLLLASDRYASAEVDALVGDALVHVVRHERTFEGEPGEFLTLLALNGPAVGVTTDGLAYPLRDEILEPGSSRGVSNVFEGGTARVTVESGVLLAVRPGVAP